jgi:hypothetical protein
MRVLFLAVAALMVLGATPPRTVVKPAAQSPAKPAGRPDFSGRWELDVARSDFGTQKTLPRGRTDVLRHRDPALVVESTTIRSNGDTLRFTMRYTTDGSEAKNKMMGQEVTTIGRWRGDTLTFDSSARVMMSEFVVLDRWSLSPDRSLFTVQRHNDSPMGKSDQSFVFVRRK